MRRAQALSAALMSVALLIGAAPHAAMAADSVITEEARTIDSQWRGTTPKMVKRGGTLTNDVWVNFNNAQGTGNVTRTVTVKAENGIFAKIPDIRFDKVNLSDDKTTMTFTATRPAGTSMLVTLPVIASGHKGEKVSTTATADKEKVKTPGVNIDSFIGANIIFNHSNDKDLYLNGLEEQDGEYTRALPLSLAVPIGAEKLKDPIEFDIQIEGSSPEWKNRDVLSADGFKPTGKVGEDIPPTSDAVPAPKTTKIEFKGNGRYHITMSGFRTDPVSQVAAGADGESQKLDTDRVYMLTGQFMARVPVRAVLTSTAEDSDNKHVSFKATVHDAKISTAETNQVIREDSLQDNSESFVAIETGTYTAGWSRNSWNLTKDLGENGHSYRVGNPGSIEENDNIIRGQGDRWSAISEAVPGDTMYGYINHNPMNIDGAVYFVDPDTEFTGRAVTSIAGSRGQGIKYQYLTKKIDDPYGIDINSLPWQDSMPSNPADVTAIKVKWPLQKPSFVVDNPDILNQSIFQVKAKNHLKTGDDVWAIGFVHYPKNDVWNNDEWRSTDKNRQSPMTDNLEDLKYTSPRYPWTTMQRDVTRIVGSRVSSQTEFLDENKEVKQGETTNLRLTSGWHSRENASGNVTIQTTLQPGLDYVSADVEPTEVKKNSDGSTTLIWAKKKLTSNEPAVYNIKVEANGSWRATTGYFADTKVTNWDIAHSDSATSKVAESRGDIAVIFDGSTNLTKRVAQSTQIAGGGKQNTWTIGVRNQDSRPQATTDVIDVLPYNGDVLGSKFHGNYTIDEVATHKANKAEIYYTTVDSKKISTDPDDPSNGSMGEPSSIWSETKPKDSKKITGIRVITGQLNIGERYTIDIKWTPDEDNRPKDIFVNGAGARATNTKLLMLQTAKSTIDTDGSVLRINKKAADKNPVLKPGGKVNYIVEVKNDSKNTAYSVSARDLGGSGINNKSIVVTKPSHGKAEVVGGAQVWNIGDLKPGETATAHVSAELLSTYTGSDVVNYAVTENPSNPPKGNMEKCQTNTTVGADNDQCDNVTIPYKGKLQISKDLTNVTIGIAPGKKFTYTVKVRNSAKAQDGVATTVPDVTVRDVPRVGLKDVKIIKTTAGKIDKGGQTVSLGDLPAGKMETLTVEATMSDDAVNTGLANSALVGSKLNPPPSVENCITNSGDITTDNDQCDTSRLKDGSNLKIDKKLSTKNASLNPGDTIEYEITALNDAKQKAGYAAVATNVVVKDLGGKGLENPRVISTSKGKVGADKKSALIGDLKPGERVTVKVKATVTKDAINNGTKNTATVGSSTQGPPPKIEECRANPTVESDDDRCDNTELIEGSKVKVDKKLTTADPSLNPGDTLNYDVVVLNDAKPKDGVATTARKVTVDDLGGKGLDKVEVVSTSKGKIVKDKKSVLIDELNAGERVTIKVKAVATKDAVKDGAHNTATVGTPVHPKPKDSTKCKVNDTVEADDDQCDTSLIREKTHVKIDKKLTTKAPSLNPGDTLNYDVVVLNDVKPEKGFATTARKVNVKDLGGKGLDKVEIVSASKGTIAKDKKSVMIDQLVTGEKVTIKVKAVATDKAGKEGTRNTATVGTPIHPEPKDSTKCEPNTTVESDKDQCDFEDLKEGSDLKIDKKLTTADPSLNPGDTLNYDVVVLNNGKDMPGVTALARKVNVKDLGGKGLEKVEVVSTSKGKIAKDKKSVMIDELKAGERVTIKVKAVVAKDGMKAGTRNTATVDNPVHPGGGNAEKCEPNATVEADKDQCDHVEVKDGTDVKIDKKLATVDPSLNPGDTLNYDLVVLNDAKKTKEPGVATTARKVNVKDLGGKGLEKVEIVSTSKGTIAKDKKSVMIDELKAGEKVTIKVKGIVTKDGGTTGTRNTATVGTPGDPGTGTSEKCEPNTTVEADKDQCDHVDVEDGTNVKVDKKFTTKGASLSPGDILDYEVTVLNDAKKTDKPGVATTARKVNVKDLGGKGLEKVEIIETSKGTIAKDKKSVMIDELKAGEKVTIKVKAAVTEEAGKDGAHNTVTVDTPVHPGGGDSEKCKPNDTVEADDDQCDHVVVPDGSKPQVDKVLSGKVENLAPGDEIEYTLKVRNGGEEKDGVASTIRNAVITDTPRAGLSDVRMVKTTAGKIAEDGQSVTIKELAPGQVETITVKAKVAEKLDDKGVHNVATVDTPVHPGPKPDGECKPNENGVESDDDQCDPETMIPSAKLQVDKSYDAEKTTAKPGEKVTYTIVARNGAKKEDGPLGAATDVTVTDTPQVGLENGRIVKITKGKIAEDGKSVHIDRLDAGEEVTMTVEATFTAEAMEKGAKNRATIDSPNNPRNSEECKVNDGLDGDDDQCDEVEIPKPDEEPTPGEPGEPEPSESPKDETPAPGKPGEPQAPEAPEAPEKPEQPQPEKPLPEKPGVQSGGENAERIGYSIAAGLVGLMALAGGVFGLRRSMKNSAKK